MTDPGRASVRRLVAVVVSQPSNRVEPALAAAMLEDVVDLVAGMQRVAGALACDASQVELARSVAWPGMPVVEVAAGAGPSAALDALAAVGAEEAAVVAADVPDLPPLLLGKLFSALRTAQVAVCPAAGGGLVAVAAALPAPAWLGECGAALDDPAALDRLRAGAPHRALHVGPGWHRIRGSADLAQLDAGLEGWDATRALLSR